jgi:hypothetical protein
MRTTIPRVKYDPERMILFGHSAGAHMATCLSVSVLRAVNQNQQAEDLPVPLCNRLLNSMRRAIKAVVGFAGIYDLVALDHDFPTYSIHSHSLSCFTSLFV